MSSAYLKSELTKAIKYLRSRGKYLGDKECRFKPTSAAATNVQATWAAYRQSVEKQELVRRIK